MEQIALLTSIVVNVVLSYEVLTLRNEVAALSGEIKGLRTAKDGE